MARKPRGPAKWSHTQQNTLIPHLHPFMVADADERDEIVQKALHELQTLPLHDLERFSTDTEKAMVCMAPINKSTISLNVCLSKLRNGSQSIQWRYARPVKVAKRQRGGATCGRASSRRIFSRHRTPSLRTNIRLTPIARRCGSSGMHYQRRHGRIGKSRVRRTGRK